MFYFDEIRLSIKHMKLHCSGIKTNFVYLEFQCLRYIEKKIDFHSFLPEQQFLKCIQMSLPKYLLYDN